MGRTMYQTCIKIVQELKKDGYLEQVSWPDLADRIRKIAGGNSITLKAYRKELQLSGFLESSNAYNFVLTEESRQIPMEKVVPS